VALHTAQEIYTGLDGPPDVKDAKECAQRRCVATGLVRPTTSLLRFVVSPEERVVPDIGGALPGRGIWVTADRACVETACQKGCFSRAARRSVKVDNALVEQIEALLVRRCVELIGLARRGGGAVAGFEKVRAFLLAGDGGLLLAAADGADEGRAKLRRVSHGLPVIEPLFRRELGEAFGREQVVHAALVPGRLAGMLREEAMRLSGFRRPNAERGTS
jgi:predicted RNA-binding protein YlxR (DUF448 family)